MSHEISPIYAIGDVHGRSDLLAKIISFIERTRSAPTVAHGSSFWAISWTGARTVAESCDWRATPCNAGPAVA